MQEVYLGLGSNLGDREAMLRGALDAIDAMPGTCMVKASPMYETAPMGPQNQGPYMNMAAKITTSLSPSALIAALQQVEAGLGRVAPEHRRHWGPRQIDIDVLLIGDAVIDEPGLTVPHPGLQDRWFVLKPLADLAPDVIHPILRQPIVELLAQVDEPASQGASQ